MPNLHPTPYTLNPKDGFTLVEILLSLFFIIAIVTILFATSGTLFTRRKSDQQSIAAKAATKEIERLRGLTFSNLLIEGDLGTYGAYPFACQQSPYPTGTTGDNDYLKNLRAGKICRNLYDYPSGEGSNPITSPPASQSKIVGVTIKVYWNNDNNVQQPPLTMDTLIYESGL